MQLRYVNLGSTAGGDGTTNNIVGADRAFASLYDAVDAVPDSPSDAYTITCTKGAGGQDTTPVTQTPLSQTTTAAYYILIQAAVGDKACIPHDTGRYTLAVTNADGIYNNTPCHLRIDGLQVQVTVTDASSKLGIKTTNANQTAADIDCRITNCVVKAIRTSGSVTGFNSRPWGGSAGGTSVIKNCATYNGYQGFNSDLAACEMYNCTSFDCDYAFVADAAFTAKNCLGSCVASYGQFVGTFSAGSDYNAEDDSGGVPGAHSHSGHAFTFVNAGADNFHLASGDVGARGLGIGPGSDAKVPTTDIDGDARSGATCDIGADEYVAAAATTNTVRMII